MDPPGSDADPDCDGDVSSAGSSPASDPLGDDDDRLRAYAAIYDLVVSCPSTPRAVPGWMKRRCALLSTAADRDGSLASPALRHRSKEKNGSSKRELTASAWALIGSLPWEPPLGKVLIVRKRELNA